MACTLYGPEKLSVAGDLYLDLPEVANDLEIQCVTGEGQSVRLQNVKREGWSKRFSAFWDYFIFKWPVAVITDVPFKLSLEAYSDLIQLASQNRIILKEADDVRIDDYMMDYFFISSEWFYCIKGVTIFINNTFEDAIWVHSERNVTF